MKAGNEKSSLEPLMLEIDRKEAALGNRSHMSPRRCQGLSVAFTVKVLCWYVYVFPNTYTSSEKSVLSTLW